MKSNTLTIVVGRPVNEVFAFAINPTNTPKWISSITEEQTNEWPIKQGTIYKNRGEHSAWSEYKVTDYVQDEIFELSELNIGYRVRYTFKPIDLNKTELEYKELSANGQIENPLTQDTMQKLKTIIEKSS